MTRISGLAFSIVALAVILARPGLASADTVPPRKTAAPESKVLDRLSTLGVDGAIAKSQVESLTPAETGFFSEDTNRVQVVGGITMFELLTGIALLAVFFIFLTLLLDHSYLK